MANPAEARALVGDGNYHGRYERPDSEVLALWQVAVAETRDIIERDWP
jgi:creatinine amidohydrolase